MFFKNFHFLIFPHKHLDGDCLGSAKAMKILIEHAGGTADIITAEDPSKTKWDYLNVKTRNTLPPVYNSCILVDCASPDRTSVPVPERTPVLIIDHHEKTSSYGDFRIIDTTAASTGIVIEDMRKELGIKLNVEYAEAILATIVSDTSGFKHDNTDQKAFAVASSMINFGADLQKIMHHEFNKNSLNTVKLYQRLIPKIQFNENGLVGLIIPYSDIKDLSTDTMHPGEFHKFITLYENYQILYILTEQENGDIKGSLRSKELEVNNIASLFGGGGHKKASGFLVPKGNLLEIEQKLKRVINNLLN